MKSGLVLLGPIWFFCATLRLDVILLVSRLLLTTLVTDSCVRVDEPINATKLL